MACVKVVLYLDDWGSMVVTPVVAVEIRDVGPRDGMQGERPVDPLRRAELGMALEAFKARIVGFAKQRHLFKYMIPR